MVRDTCGSDGVDGLHGDSEMNKSISSICSAPGFSSKIFNFSIFRILMSKTARSHFLIVSVNVDISEPDNIMIYFSMTTNCSQMKNS